MVENKTEIIPVRVTPSQAKDFRSLAAEEGQRVSEWLRDIAKREVKQSRVA